MPAEREEQAYAALLELAPRGLEERDTPSGTEVAVYGDAWLAAEAQSLFDVVEVVLVEPGWEDAWRAFHQPVEVGDLWVGPPWCAPPAGVPSVVIDPGRAFGTGAHPTTRLCLELVSDLPRGSLCDVGCGSGVLALAALRLGFAPVVALDDDQVAVEVSRANAAANALDLDVRCASASADVLPDVDVVVANVSLRVVEDVLARCVAHTAVTAGYLAHERPSTSGWSHLRRIELDGWAADLFARENV